MQVLIREGSVCKDLHALSPDHHRAQLAVHRLLHRRPQSARHRRGGPSRFHHPHRDPAWRRAARRLSRRDAFRPPASLGCATAASSRRAGGPISSSSTISRLAPCRRSLTAAAWSTTRCSPRAGRSLRSGATASRRGGRGRRLRDARQGPSTLAIGVIPGKIITERVPVTLPYAQRRARRRSRPGHGQGLGGRAPRRQRQHGDGLRAAASA